MAPAQPLTEAQFAALAELLSLRGGPATEAARLMLVDGLTAIQAAERAGVSRQAATNAAARCRRGFDLARLAAKPA